MFVYHPCDDAMLSALELEGRGWMPQPVRRIIRAEIVTGMDELGVLIAGHAKNAYWFGSQLSIAEARRHVPYTNATCLQVAAGALGATIWASAIRAKDCARPTRSISARCSRSRGPTSARWSAPIPTGRRCRAAANCSTKSWSPTSRGCSRTCAPASGAPNRFDPGKPHESAPRPACSLALIAGCAAGRGTAPQAADHARGRLADEAPRRSGAVAGRPVASIVPVSEPAYDDAKKSSDLWLVPDRRQRAAATPDVLARQPNRIPPGARIRAASRSRPSARARMKPRSTCSTSRAAAKPSA